MAASKNWVVVRQEKSSGDKLMALKEIYFRVVSLSLCVMLFVLNTPVNAATIDRVLVVVNDEAITLKDLEARRGLFAIQNNVSPNQVTPALNKQVIETFINEKIQLQRAEQRNLKVSDAEVEGSIHLIAQQNNTTADVLLAQLESDGISTSDFKRVIYAQQMIQLLVDVEVNRDIVVSDQEVDNFLLTHKELMNENESYDLSHLFLRSSESDPESDVDSLRQQANSIRESILNGESFDTLAKAHSDGSNKDNGGYLGWRKSTQLPELFVNTLRIMDAGELSEVLQTNNGFHLLKLHGREGGAEMTVQHQIRHILIRESSELDALDAEELVIKIHQDLLAGESFEKMARLYSVDYSSKSEGGLLNWINPGAFAPELDRVMNQLSKDEISQPIRTQYGYHLIKLLDRRSIDISRDLAQNKARENIYQRKSQELYSQWISTIRDGSYIDIIDSSYL